MCNNYMSDTIYILKLKNNKYYIGKSNNVEKRYNDHVNGIGSTWTTLNKPIKIIKTIPNCNNFDEDKYTKEYMSKYGINNVRGGTYTKEILDNNTIKLLETEIRGSNDLCYKCGSKSHFAKDCNLINEEELYVYSCNRKKLDNCCFKCGRSSHFANNCYATTNIHGKKIIYHSKNYKKKFYYYDSD